MSALTPPFAYFGGKTTLAPRIAELLPRAALEDEWRRMYGRDWERGLFEVGER